jgi:hypothetical protein
MSDLNPYWAYADYSLFIYREKTQFKKKLDLRKPRDLSLYLLGLAYLAPINHQWYSTTLLFNLFGNYCCCNKLIDTLVLQTLLYYYRVIRGHLLLTPLPFITISFITWNWFSIFWLISYWVTALRPFCVESSVL